MNDNLKAFSLLDLFPKKSLSPLAEKIPLINYSMLRHIFSPLMSNSHSFHSMKLEMISKEQDDEINDKIKAIERGIYLKASAVFSVCCFLTKSLFLDPIQLYFISSAKGFRMFKIFKIFAIPSVASLSTYEFIQGVGIDLNCYFPQTHPLYNLLYFDVYYKRDMLDLININSLDDLKHNQLSDYSISTNKNKREIENVLNFFVIKQHYLIQLLVKKILLTKGYSIKSKPFNPSIYDTKNWEEFYSKNYEIEAFKTIQNSINENKNEIPKIWIETNNLKEHLEMNDILLFLNNQIKLSLLFKFVREYKNLIKENEIIEENKIDRSIEEKLEWKINTIGKLVEHDIYTSNLYKKYKIFKCPDK